MTRILKLIAALMVLLIVVGVPYAILLEGDGRLRSYLPGSKLNRGDTQIESVDDEFMRRSPDLQANFQRFKDCMEDADAYPACDDVEGILLQREAIIVSEWPAILERLRVDRDWYNNDAHGRFRRVIHEYPPEIYACLPIIEYRKQSDTGNIIHTYEGLRDCTPRIAFVSPV